MRTKRNDFVVCPLCQGKYQSLQSHLNRHGVSLTEFKERFPGLPFQTQELAERRSKSAVRINTGRILSEETKSKISNSLYNSPEKLSGDRHPRWSGGKGVYNKTWNALSALLIEKYKVCQNKNCRENSNALVVHHIDFDSKNDSLDNLQVLCKSCHALVHNVAPKEEHRKMRKVFYPIKKRDANGRILPKQK